MPNIYTLFIDPGKPDKLSMSRVLALLFALAAVVMAYTLESPDVIVLEFLAAATACLGVRTQAK